MSGVRLILHLRNPVIQTILVKYQCTEIQNLNSKMGKGFKQTAFRTSK
jgi:hypothetical protein